MCGLPAGDNVGTEGNLSPNGTVDLLRGYVFCGEISGHNDSTSNGRAAHI